jgi:pimeloyl-ACP methyl ester carboxylesterase
MVLIHGFTGSHQGFQYIIPLLPTIRFIVPDLPGFGKSSLNQTDWSIDAIAAKCNEFVEKLDLNKPHILGHSMGGLVVSSMLDQAPDLYDNRAVLLSPVPTAIRRNDSRRIGAILGALQFKLGYKVPLYGEKLVKSHRISKVATNLIMTTTDRELQKAIHGHHLGNLKSISSIEFYSHLHSDINKQGSIEHAEALRAFDILLISGGNDNVTPLKEMQRFANAIQPEEFIILPGIGHLAHYEKPRDVAEAVDQFISRR